MFKLFTEFFIKYAKNTAPLRMLIHIFFFVIAVTWLGIVSIVVTNFTTIADMYNRMQAEQNIGVENALTMSTQINRLLIDQRIRMGVDRIYISKFHDGKVDVNGSHFIYFSRISETTANGVSNELNNTQNLPLSIFPDMLEPLAHDQCYYIRTVDSTVENHIFLTDMGVKSMIVCPIIGDTGRLIGILGVDGVLNEIAPNTATGLEQSLTTLANILGGLITTQ